MPDDTAWQCGPCTRGQHDDCDPIKNMPEGVKGILVCVCRRANHGRDVVLPEATDDQPDSPVQALVNAAAWLDGYDRMALGIARQMPDDEAKASLEAIAANDLVQAHLLRMARWLAERPSIAALMWAETEPPPVWPAAADTQLPPADAT